MLETSAGVRITVWRPYKPDRPLTLLVGDSETITAVDNDVRLQQEVFAWQVSEDIWGGLIDAELRETLGQRFINDFEPVLLPDQRSIIAGIQSATRFDGSHGDITPALRRPWARSPAAPRGYDC